MIRTTKRFYKVSSKGNLLFLLLGAALLPLASAQAQSDAASFCGEYSFYLSGQEKLPTGGSALEAIVGNFYADGQGHVTGGELDKNSETGLVQVSSLTGVYSFNMTTGDGQVTLNLPTGPLNLAFYTYPRGPSVIPCYGHLEATIVATGGTLLGGSGRLADVLHRSSQSQAVDFTLDGESAAAASAASGFVSLNIPLNELVSSTNITGRAELIENGMASFYPDITGTATAVDSTARLTLSLTGFGTGTKHYAAYEGEFSTGTVVLLSLDPHGSAPLLMGTNEVNLPSYLIGYSGHENF